ncbi:hypothetical protein LBMAG42_47860 [Deltaproteobacteria bacterium]|nr:hypothetical protein LBMAG42_47860 [Deltaproteobacteria bacterium]
MPKRKSDIPAIERGFQRALEEAPAAISLRKGPDHRCVFVNRAHLESTDGRPQLGRAFAEAFPELAAQGFVKIFDRVYATGEPFVADGRRADVPTVPGGPLKERYWNLTFQATHNDDGVIDGVSTFAFDVTDHVRARREAEEARRQYDELVNTLGIVVWRVDPEGWRPEWVRGHVAEVLGIEPEAALQPEAWWAGIHPDDVEVVRAARSSVRRAEYRVEYRRLTGDEAWRWIAESGQLRQEAGAEQPSAWGLLQDVTERVLHRQERERLQDHLLHVQKLESLGVLAGGVAHDFNNLLTAILGNASLAEMQLTTGHPATRAVNSMVAAARRASDLTRQLLAFSGRGHFKVLPTDVNEQVVELTVLLEASIPKKVNLRIEPHENLPLVAADGSQLSQVLMNLVINGAEAIDEQGGTVVVRTGVQVLEQGDLLSVGPFAAAAPGAFVFVEVSDSGAGMDESTLARIFDPFFTTKVNGRGLGLAAVQGIIRGHQGLIRVYSEPGRGTTFKVFLPALTRGALQYPPAETPAGRLNGTVLVVDDEPSVREFARAALEFGGYRVVEAADGRLGVDAFRALAGEIDVVLLDLTMPRMSGEEALSEMRKIRPATRVILSSGYNEVEATRRLVGRASVEFIQKPYTVRELLALLGARTTS